MTLGFARHCDEIVTQTSLLAGHLGGADVTVPVPTCPGWNVSQLARHVDGGQRWARDIVATRASEPPSDVALRDLSVGGLSAISDTPLQAGERVTVFFPPQGLLRGWDAYGRIVRCDSSTFGYRVAVEFDSLQRLLAEPLDAGSTDLSRRKP